MRFLVLMAALVATPAAAQDPFGCFTRHYSTDHLAENPDQVVENIWVTFFEDDAGNTAARIGVTTSDQGHVAGTPLAGRYFEDSMNCHFDGEERICGVACDRGQVSVTRYTFESLELVTHALEVGYDEGEEGCGDGVNLAEDLPEDGPAEAPTTYRLFKSPPEGCVVN